MTPCAKTCLDLKKVWLKLHLPFLKKCFLKPYVCVIIYTYIYSLFVCLGVCKKKHILMLKFLISKLGFKYVGLPENSSASDCRDLAGCQFSCIGKEKILKLVMRSHVGLFLFMFTSNYRVCVYISKMNQSA